MASVSKIPKNDKNGLNCNKSNVIYSILFTYIMDYMLKRFMIKNLGLNINVITLSFFCFVYDLVLITAKSDKSKGRLLWSFSYFGYEIKLLRENKTSETGKRMDLI